MAIVEAIKSTKMSTIVGDVNFGAGPVPNVTKTPLVAGQWQKSGDAMELVITNNAAAPSIPLGGELKLLSYGMTAYESKGFGGYDAIEGATIYNGPPRGAALNRARALVRLATGMDEGDGYTGIQVNWGQAVATMTDGSADAHILPLNFPDGRHAQAASSGAMVAYSFPLKAFESERGVNYGKAPGTAAVTQPITDDLFGSGIKVLSEDGNFRGYADVGGEVVNVAMSDDIAYGLTKAHIEGLDALGARAPMMPTAWLGEMDTAKTGMCGPNPMKYHPGAVRAWEEAGYAIPDCAKP